jgi:fructose-1,6-bisphosphatase/inositol monophosphatase family enzyme
LSNAPRRQSVQRRFSNAAFVAAGRLDAYMAAVLRSGTCAGLLMVEEAGGAHAAIDGSPLILERPEFIAAASQPLEIELLRILAR